MVRVRQLSFLLFVAVLVLTPSARADIEITLENSFIDKYRSRATIEASFTVDKAHAKPNSPSKDGDLHIAGRAPEIRLPTVAELMNAKFEKKAMELIHDAEGSDEPIRIAGAWRLWCEHGGSKPQIQGQPLKPFNTTNPDHVFEIHPVTQVGMVSTLGSLKPIKGYKAKDAERAFQRYENVKCEIKPNGTATQITTTMAGFNYVEFKLEISGAQQVVDDGRLVMCKVLDLDEELLVRNRRMVFVKDSAPEKLIKTKKKGDRVKVLGIPRISLELVHWRTEHAKERPEVLNWRLPYEIIVVGVYEDDDDDEAVSLRSYPGLPRLFDGLAYRNGQRSARLQTRARGLSRL